jgi:cysteine desulfurase
MVGSILPSHVLMAMGRTAEEAGAAVRFSLGKWTTGEEIERVIALLPGIVTRMHDASHQEEATHQPA